MHSDHLFLGRIFKYLGVLSVGNPSIYTVVLVEMYGFDKHPAFLMNLRKKNSVIRYF